MKLDRLTRAGGPWLHALTATPSDLCDALWGLERAAAGKLAARRVRGRKMATAVALFDEFAAALQFPYYFGENWDAFHDCLSDLSWLRAEAVVVGVADALHLLKNAPAEDVGRFLAVVNEAGRHFNEPAAPRTARPFHVIFHAVPEEEAAMRRRWEAAGAVLNPLG